MPKSLEDRFDEIAQRAVEEAERIVCPFGSFVEGLKTMRATINDRLQNAIEEHESRGGN